MPNDREHAYEASSNSSAMATVLLDIWNRLDALEQWSETQPYKLPRAIPRCQNKSYGHQCDKEAGHDGVHHHREGSNINVWYGYDGQWRELVDARAERPVKHPMRVVLHNMWALSCGVPPLRSYLAQIVAVCEQQVPGWKANPYESDFSVYRLASAFGCSLRDSEPHQEDWRALGNEAASWLKHLVENNND